MTHRLARTRRRLVAAMGLVGLPAACDAAPLPAAPGRASLGVRAPDPPTAHEDDPHEHDLGDHVHRYAPDSASQACLDRYARARGYGLGDGLDAEELRARCMDRIGDEEHCEVQGLISLEAARCIAGVKGLDAGLDPWKLTLVVDPGHSEIIWNVTSVTSRSEYGVQTKSVQIDASSGEQLIGGQDHVGGRPLYGDDGHHVTAAVQASGWTTAPHLRGRLRDLRASVAALDPATRLARGKRWLRDALDEHAAIAAFARAAMELQGLGAPAPLVHAHLAAAADERRHAELFFALSGLALERAVGPGPLVLPRLSTPRSPRDIVIDLLRGGCINETIAGLELEAQALCETDPHLRRAFLEVASDELEHAVLAWRTLGWVARAHGLPPVRVLPHGPTNSSFGARAWRQVVLPSLQAAGLAS